MAGGSRCECSTDRSRPTWCAGLRSSAWPAGGRALCSPPTLRCRRRAGATPPVNDAQRAVCRRIETDPDAPTRARCRPTQHSVGAAAAAAPARAGAPPPTTTEMGCELPSRWTSRLTCAARGTQTHRDRSRRSTRARCRPAYTASVRRQIAAPAHGRALASSSTEMGCVGTDAALALLDRRFGDLGLWSGHGAALTWSALQPVSPDPLLLSTRFRDTRSTTWCYPPPPLRGYGHLSQPVGAATSVPRPPITIY